MNVLFVHQEATAGGLETRVLTEGRALVARGHRVFSAHRRGTLSPAFAAAGITELSFDPLRSLTALDATVEELRALIRAHGITVVDLHPQWAVLPGAIAAALEGVPFALNFHGVTVYDEERLGLVPSVQILAPFASLVTANSPATARALDWLGPKAQGAVLTVPNTIDTALFERTPEVVGGLPRRVALLSRLDADKIASVEAAARFVAALAERSLAGVPLELTVFGGGQAEADARRVLEGLPPGTGAGRLSITWAGPTHDAAGAIAGADLVLGMGRVVLEGLAARRPVVLAGVLGNLAGLVRPSNVDRWFESNLNGRNAPDRPAAEVVDELLTLGAPERRALADWAAEKAGPAALRPWIEALEDAARRGPTPGAEVVAAGLLGMAGHLRRLVPERDRGRAATAELRRLLGEVELFLRTVDEVWPLDRHLAKHARSVYTLIRRFPRLRSAAELQRRFLANLDEKFTGYRPE